MKTLRGKRLIVGIVTVLLMVGGVTDLIVGASTANAADPVGPKLKPRLRQLLTEEMKSIKQASEQIYNGMIVGDHSVVANMAEQIHNSFILNRELTEQDKKDLKVLPPEFLKMDGDFHATAKKLMHAAEQKDSDLQRYYFGKMTESCQTCHSTYVTDRFPGFAGEAPAGHVH